MHPKADVRRLALRLIIGAFIVKNLKGKPRPDWWLLPEWRGKLAPNGG